MEKIQIVLQTLSIVGIGVLVLLLYKYLPTYVTKKAENLATKEDIGEITHRVEEARTQHLAALERVKSGLSDESAALLRRRQIYEETVKALRVFVADTNPTDEQKDKEKDKQKQEFLGYYQTLWLWASDSVIRALNQFLDINKSFVASPDATRENLPERAFAEIILAMRRDIGFPASELQTAEYQLFNFVEYKAPQHKLISDRTG